MLYILICASKNLLYNSQFNSEVSNDVSINKTTKYHTDAHRFYQSLELDELFYTHFGPRMSEGALKQTLNEFKDWMRIVEDGIEQNLNSQEILDILFLTQDGLKLTDIKHGIHQRNTHLGSVEGMMNWAMRNNETK